jgi:hypothetical protein
LPQTMCAIYAGCRPHDKWLCFVNCRHVQASKIFTRFHYLRLAAPASQTARLLLGAHTLYETKPNIKSASEAANEENEVPGRPAIDLFRTTEFR